MRGLDSVDEKVTELRDEFDDPSEFQRFVDEPSWYWSLALIALVLSAVSIILRFV